MLENYKNFFAEDGITSTSANHLCNIARENIAAAKAELSHINFIEVSMRTIGVTMNPVILKQSTNNLSRIIDCIDKIAKSNAFIAYMQEAIKAKTALFKETQAVNAKDYAKEKGIEFPESPFVEDKKTFDDFFNELTIKEKSRYYALEAEAAIVGKTIHPDGALHTARKEMFDAISNPAIVDNDKVYDRVITVNQDEVEELYFSLQKRHRAVEAELNAIKNSIELKVKEHNAAVDSKFDKEWHDYSVKTKSIQNELTTWKNEEAKRINKLKIAIPNSLRETYEFLSSL